MTEWKDLEAHIISDDLCVSAPKTLAPERKRTEIKVHPIGCLERRSSIHQAELEPFQPRTPSSMASVVGMPVQQIELGVKDDGRDATGLPGQDPFRPENCGGFSHRFDVAYVAAGTAPVGPSFLS